MPKILVHVTCGPDDPTRAALAFFVARAGLEEGHSVTVFLAGDAVQLLRDPVLDGVQGLGTGSLREHYGKIVDGGGKFVLSAASSKSRGLLPSDLEGKPYEFGTPSALVRLAVDHDRVINY